LDLQVVLVDARQFHDRQDVVALLKHVDGWEGAAAGRQIVKPVAKHGLNGSMGRRGNPYDNAKAESFMKTLKVEEIYMMEYETFDDVAASLPRFIEDVFNVLLSLKRNTPGRSPFERRHICPSQRGTLQPMPTFGL
jgi:putative transposase